MGGAPYGGDSLADKQARRVKTERIEQLLGLWNLVPVLFYVRNLFFLDFFLSTSGCAEFKSVSVLTCGTANAK